MDKRRKESQGQTAVETFGSLGGRGRARSGTGHGGRSGVITSFGLIAALLLAVNLLPPDTAMKVIEERGTLRACVPTDFPPLVTADAERPGIDIEVLQEVASRLGLRLQLHANPAIGRDFNPRNWRVTRAQCEVLAGGVVASNTTRSFLETSSPHMETGWAVIAVPGVGTLTGAKVGFYAGTSGLDRIALSRFLQSFGATVTVLNSRQALQSGLTSGQFDVGVSESLTARQVTQAVGAEAMWLPEPLPRYPIALGLWKGDQTLQRSLDTALTQMRRDGTLERIIDSYQLGDISAACAICS